jgi:hypothetical protein
MFLFEWCNVLMHIYVCLLVSVRLRFALRFGDQEIKLFEFYEDEDPEHLFGEGKCPLTYYVPFTL